MKGYKVFKSDWTCRDFQYKVGKTYEMDEQPIMCQRGFHFCEKLKDCFYWYPFCKYIKIAEIEALGKIDFSYLPPANKFCTNKIKIIREIKFEDLEIIKELKIIDNIRKWSNSLCIYRGDIVISNSQHIIRIADGIYMCEYQALIDVKEKK